ncbi:riboflavin synthase [Chlorobaculum thiosulfatiphilum]|jgi:riboflavin synthase|uniref:Riboflavin synthase n=1 Tax=Chlorobaculum thiosulfatiphilum TaxID=115852 RepID=A0A5C4S0Z4_CHLTI|nr:riboflavin synthase [Chlorobaculum thiosulfatiphilum]TNJ36792.1 riboflavin synthase [Chlorobaculum thiosulfatiphilum]
MFTGIVKDIGAVEGTARQGSGVRLKVRYTSQAEFGDLSIDESVSINGACQTAVAVGPGWFEVDTVAETLKKTTLGAFRPGTPVNLERAVRPMDRLGGHFVLGHVDGVGRVTRIEEVGGSRMISVAFDTRFDQWIVSAGSIAIDGVSLTVASVEPGQFTVAIIPYTFGHTTITGLGVGSEVNLEFDILGKYVARQNSAGTPAESRITESWLSGQGFA